MINYEAAMGEARVLSQSSTCAKRKVGAVVLKDQAIVGRGANGPPENLACPLAPPSTEEDDLCVHAEKRALEGISSADIIFSTFLPCPACMELIAKAGIRSVIFMEEPRPSYIRYDKYESSKRFAREEGINVLRYPPTI